jgi:nucleoside-diphosphate-sugar epimerase
MRILVIGAAGLTGAEVCRVLVARGHSLVGLTRRPESSVRIPDGVERVVVDCRETEAVSERLAGIDVVVHVAGILFGEDLARARGIGDMKLIVVSTAGIYSAHRASVDAYRRNEAALRAVSMRLTVVRPTMIYGSGRDRNVHHVIGWARRWGLLPIVGRGDQRIQPIHYADVAAALASFAERPVTGTFDAGGGAALTVHDAAVAIFGALGRPPRLVSVPRVLALGAARGVDAVRGSRWAERIERLTEDRSVDNSALVAVTGLVPRDFATGLRDQMREMRLR